MKRQLTTTAVLGCALAIAPMAAAHADTATSPTNFVGVESTAGDTVNHYGHLQVATYGGNDVEAKNEALSYSHDCTGCHSVTIAFQVVLVKGSPSTFAPENLAEALNVSCTSCDTEAFARQLVVQTRRLPHLNEAAQGAIDVVNARLQQLAAADLTPQEREQQVEALWLRIEQVVCDHSEDGSQYQPSCTDVPVRTG